MSFFIFESFNSQGSVPSALLSSHVTLGACPHVTQKSGSESEAGSISENFSHPSDVLLGSPIQFYTQSTIQTQNSPASLPH